MKIYPETSWYNGILYHLWMKLKAFIVIVCVQLVIVIFLLLQIQNNYHNNVLGISVNPINSATIEKTQSKNLKYFYEPKANTIEEAIHENWLSSIPKYTINSDALNERYNYDMQKKDSVFRIITLGDSFTFGRNVSTKYNWTEVLEDLLNKNATCSIVKKYEVINLGVSGYDTAYEVERYKLRGVKYNADLLLMLIVDFMRMTDYRTEHREYFIPLETQKVKGREEYFTADKEDEKLKDSVRISYQYPQYDRLFSMYSGNVIIVDHEKNQKAKDFFNILGKKYPKLLYTKTTFPIGEKKTSLPDGHPNEVGHRAIAEDIFKYLIENNLIPCAQQMGQK